MLHAKFQDPMPLGSGEEDFLMFYHIWTWIYKFSFLLPIEASYKISL